MLLKYKYSVAELQGNTAEIQQNTVEIQANAAEIQATIAEKQTWFGFVFLQVRYLQQQLITCSNNS